MKSLDAENLLLQIDNSLDDINRIGDKALELEAYLAKYLTVFICGIYEAAIEAIVNEMASSAGSKELENFVSRAVDKTFRNPDVGNICELLRKFNPDWSQELKAMDSANLQALDSIVTNKNNIAHGVPCSITLSEIQESYKASRPVIEKIDKLVL